MTSRSDRIEQVSPCKTQLTLLPDLYQSKQIFQRVEEESERRAQAEHAERSDPTQNVLTMISPAAAATLRVPRERRRGSVTVSRFGQVSALFSSCRAKAENLHIYAVGRVFPRGIRQAMWHTNKCVVYRAEDRILPSSDAGLSFFFPSQRTRLSLRYLNQTGSADSLASATDDAGAHDHVDEEQFIQVENIAGKQSISKAISRRLSRSKTRSRDVLSSANSSVIIGVSVEEATVEHEAHDDAEGRAGTSVAYCPATLPRRESRGSMAGEKGERGAAGGWLGKAKGLTHKFRRKSIPVLSQTSS